MKSDYQSNYASKRPQMYDIRSRIQKAKRILKTLETHLGKEKLKDLDCLDIGASTGIIDDELSKSFRKMVGADIDKIAIEFAKLNFKRKNLKFSVADAMNLSFANDSFDIVICTHVYEHVPDTKRLFKEIVRVLKKGGICYLAAQNKLFPWEPHYDLPFLSWLPKKAADYYVKVVRGKEEYYEHPMSYWELKRVLNKFKVYEYTGKILRNPKKFGYDDVFYKYLLPIIYCLSPLAKFLSPTFFWILEKQ